MGTEQRDWTTSFDTWSCQLTPSLVHIQHDTIQYSARVAVVTHLQQSTCYNAVTMNIY